MTDDFVFEIINRFNTSEIVALDFCRNGTHLSLKKKEACTQQISENIISNRNIIPDNEEKESNVENENININKNISKKSEKIIGDENSYKASESDYLKSPIVGTFYRAPSPDSPAYAEKGKKIRAGEPICIIEAMKMMNTLNAEYDLEISDVLVENGDLVEYGQPLFAVVRL